jgi:hypothetical protein
VHLLRTFFSHRIQLLWPQKTKMWLYPGPSCLDHPSSEELSTTDSNTWIHKVLDLGANSNARAGPSPLEEGVASTRDSMVGPLFMAYMILSFHRAHGHA